jgi:hypothetical protein
MSIPITLGITGHRDILQADESAVSAAVRKIIALYRRRYPNSPIRLLSALADGADRLVARIAREEHCELVGVLPMPRDEYEADFDEPSRAEFRSMIAECRRVIELPIPDGPRHKAYENVGRYIVSHAQALLAVWDGVDNGKPGGTSAVVAYALGSASYRQAIPDAEDSIPVYYVPTRRRSAPDRSPEDIPRVGCNAASDEGLPVLYSTLWQSMQTDAEEAVASAREFHDSTLERMDTFNADAIKAPRRDPAGQSRSLSYLLPADVRSGLEGAYADLFAAYGAADSLAAKYQRLTFRLLKLLLLLGVVTFFWVGFFDEIYGNPLILLLVPVSFAAAVVTLKWTGRNRTEDRFYDYRALAEGLRVQVFFNIIGLGTEVHRIYNRKFKGIISWIIEAIKNANLGNDVHCRSGDIDSRTMDIVRKHWIDDQHTYFLKSSRRRGSAQTHQDRRAAGFFVTGMLFVALLFAGAAFRSWTEISVPGLTHEWSQHVLLLLIDVSFAVGAVFSGYAEKRQFDNERRQFQRTAALFHRGLAALDGLSPAEDADSIRRIVRELGREVLEENGDWIVFNRSSPIEMPT